MTRFRLRTRENRVSRDGAGAAGAPRPPTYFKIFLSLALLVSALGGPGFLCGEKPAQKPTQREDPLKGTTLVRCQFAEGRLVVRRDDRLFVLRKGDHLPVSPLVVVGFSKSQVTLKVETAPQGASGTESPSEGSIVVITQKEDGRLEAQTICNSPAQRPAALPMSTSAGAARPEAREFKTSQGAQSPGAQQAAAPKESEKKP